MSDWLAGWGFDVAVVMPLVSALGWSLLHFLWQGALIAAVYAGASWLLRNARPLYRYHLGLVALGAMLAAPIATFSLLLESAGAATAAVPLAWSEPALSAVTATTGMSEIDLAAWIEKLLPFVVFAWALGVVAMSGRVGVNWIRMFRLSRRHVKPLSPELLERITVLKSVMGVWQRVRVLETTRLNVPTVMGWLRPVILLPTSSLVGLSPAQLELVIAHELGHIRRLDYLVNLFQILVETLLFYHPLVRWVSAQVRDEREKCCDDLVVATCGNRMQYARALANLESMRDEPGLPAMAATGGQLVQRIERIVCAHRRRDALSTNSGALMLLIIGVVLVAGQMADPMAVFEERRARLADVLVAKLGAEQAVANQDYVALGEARVVDDPLEPRVSAPTVEAERSAPTVQTPIAKPDPSPSIAVVSIRTSAIDSAEPPAVTVPEVPVWQAPVIEDNPLSAPSGFDEAAAIERNTIEVAKVELTVTAPDVLPTRAPAAEPQGPIAIRRMSPDYPVKARLSGQEGFVQVAFQVGYDGRVHNVKVVDSWPRRVFDRAAKRAIKAWRFDPSTVVGSAPMTQRFDFTLGRTADSERDRSPCLPLTGTRICRNDTTALMAEEANLN